jgi:molecular chaperone DnaK
LTKASHQVAEVLYKSQAAAGAAGGAGGSGGSTTTDGAGTSQAAGGKGQDNVVDAEFVDVDESKRPN